MQRTHSYHTKHISVLTLTAALIGTRGLGDFQAVHELQKQTTL